MLLDRPQQKFSLITIPLEYFTELTNGTLDENEVKPSSAITTLVSKTSQTWINVRYWLAILATWNIFFSCVKLFIVGFFFITFQLFSLIWVFDCIEYQIGFKQGLSDKRMFWSFETFKRTEIYESIDFTVYIMADLLIGRIIFILHLTENLVTA